MSDNSTKRLHNSGATEMVYDGEGHIIAAGESITVEAPLTDDKTKSLVKSGRLVEVKEPYKTPARTASKSTGDAKNGEQK